MSNAPVLMFNDERSGGQVGFRHHLIEDSQTLWVRVRLADIRLEREDSGARNEPRLAVPSCHV